MVSFESERHFLEFKLQCLSKARRHFKECRQGFREHLLAEGRSIEGFEDELIEDYYDLLEKKIKKDRKALKESMKLL